MVGTSSHSKVIGRGVFAALVTVWIPIATAAEPGGNDDKQAGLVVPEMYARLGRVYQVVPTEGPQMQFTSRAKAEKFKGESHGMVGYAVVPEGEETKPETIAVAEFRLPVASIDTGKPKRNEHMLSPRWLNAASFPDIVFKLKEVRDARLVKARDWNKLYRATLVGDLTLLDVTKEISVSARVTVTPESQVTQKIAPGDHLEIKCRLRPELSEFGIGVGDPAIERGRVSDRLVVNIHLTLATGRPDKD